MFFFFKFCGLFFILLFLEKGPHIINIACPSLYKWIIEILSLQISCRRTSVSWLPHFLSSSSVYQSHVRIESRASLVFLPVLASRCRCCHVVFLSLFFFIFEPTCAYCTVGSYASLSVCLSVCHWIIIHNSKSNWDRKLKLYQNILCL